ncbi:LysE family translocator [Afifella sp. IM 167]|uniref:LysE family translocator n=1 Tax=Afifella sp. IM 167 TaxID=2033586 RepID=UPI001CCCED9C|nr:LysE family translocator [Afifella sp. IM 167]MBZ8135239.1 lysine transporter LysE [Afifella sp. IM 167]
MSTEIVSALVVFALVASMTPGPNNLMLLASGVNFGFRRTIPHLLGILIGFAVLLTAVGLGVGALVERFPALHLALKVVGGAYLLYLAWKIAASRALHEESTGRGPLTFTEAALFQWVNPKAWMMGLAAMAAYTDPEHYSLTLAIVVGVFFLVTIPSTTIWAGFGSALKDWLDHPVRLKWFNIAMAVALVASLWPMLK